MRTQNLSARLKRYWIAIPLALVTLNAMTPAPRAADDDKSSTRLPTGAWLDPAGRSFDVGNMPLAMALAPEGNHFIVSLNGWREQGVQVVERATGRVTQTLKQPAAFFGLAFSPDGQTLYASGGNQDAVYRYSWRDGKATPVDQIVLAEKKLHQDGTRFPAGLAMSRDGQQLYIAENIADMLAVVDVASKRVVQRLKTDHYPYAVAVSGDGDVYVSAWGGNSVSVFQAKGGQLAEAGKIVVGRHPSALALNAQGTRLFVACASADRVAVVDTTKRRVVKELQDSPPAGPREGSTPDALALAPDGTRLFVAEADNNAVAVFDLSTATAGVTTKHAKDALAGRIPVGWYPTALVAAADSLWVLNGKGRGTKANPDRRKPGESSDGPPTSYVLGQLDGTITELPSRPDAAGLQRARAAGVPTAVVAPADFPDRAAWDVGVAKAVGVFAPGLVVLAGFMRLLGPGYLDEFGDRTINTHPALLPSFPGAHAVRDALAHGVKVTGASVILVDAGTDTGPIVAQRAVEVRDGDDEPSLHERIKVVERELLVDVVSRMARRGWAVADRKVSLR